ncbi:SDR family oxidoreductase [Alkalicoccus halolimnae]|jgi:3-oxoacyl-[acyl-carrier protein] reductase|uniref:SDR family oxidoreductase n=1 Tax=Alkalicoccus halolimnae TaxID=1667239 RepID=A0A5C7EZZ6_9BACI|nr:SDR family oxidoreductase [Alkalicoccus halolimnae]TXF82307.1 SDR family oxidoreductase [Alkalicoccus halolimnae]
MKSAGKLALVTGVGRTKGLGAAVCKKLASEGADIAFTYWHEYDETMPWGKEKEGPAQTFQAVTSFGKEAFSKELDLSKPDNIPLLFAEVKNHFGRTPDILINNAAHSVNDNIKTVTAASLDRHYEINVRAVTLLIQEFLHHLDRNRSGRIINIATGWSRGQMPEEISYVVTKSAAETLVHSISAQLAKRNVTINAVNPGPTDTGWMTEEIQQELTPLFPGGRIGRPEDAAEAVAFLVSDAGAWITGQVLHSEGGFLNRDSPGENI